MNFFRKSPLEVHREILASGVFERTTQKAIAAAIGVNQCTISRIANGNFKKVNKSVTALCKYAKINVRSGNRTGLRAAVESIDTANDPERKKLVYIIGLAVDLLESP